jgi:hypothetical protein
MNDKTLPGSIALWAGSFNPFWHILYWKIKTWKAGNPVHPLEFFSGYE